MRMQHLALSAHGWKLKLNLCQLAVTATQDTCIKWDAIKEDIYVRTVNKMSTSIQHHVQLSSEMPVPTRGRCIPERAKKFVNETTSDDAPWVTIASMPTLADSPAVAKAVNKYIV